MRIDTLNNHEQLYQAIFAQIVDMTPDEVRHIFADRRTVLYTLSRMIRRYHLAREAGYKFGLVGVGCISFANARMVNFQQRLIRRAGRRA